MDGSAIRAGVLLPPRDDLPAAAGEIAALLFAYAAERGGVELRFAAPEGTPAARAQTLREFVRAEAPLALVASFTDGAEAELAAAADDIGIPLLATLSANPQSSIAPSAFLRDLCGGVVEQSVALIRCCGAGPVALLHTDERVAAAIIRRAENVEAFDARDVDAGRLGGYGAVLFAGADPAMPRLFQAMAGTKRWPALLLAGAALPPSAFDRVKPSGGVWIALPTTTRDERPEALAEYLEMVRRHRIATHYRFSQFAALTSLALFLDALRRCDGGVTRQSLLRAVDDTRGFHSGLLPALTYGAERHIGSTGAWVLAVHKGLAVSPVWVE